MKHNSELVPPELSEDTTTLRTIKAEVNLINFPFFSLSNRDANSRIKTEYRITAERDGEKLEALWHVTANAEYGYPTPFDRKVHRAIEYLITKRGFPVQNPFSFSTYQILKALGFSAKSGANIRKTKEAIERIVLTGIKSEGAFYDKQGKKYITDVFHLYERVVFKGTELPNGIVADTNYVFFSEWYLRNLNAYYVRPIDFQYLNSLGGNIAGRLYELLGIKFYGVILNHRHYWKVEYRELCNLLPITPQKYLSLAKRSITRAHQELTETQFLSKVVWDTKDKEHWYLRYYPGKRAREEAKSRPVQERLQLEAPQEAPSDTSEGTPDQQKLLLALVRRGVGKRQASRLVRDHSQWIKRAIELWELERKRNPGAMKNPAGYLVSIIKTGEDWQPPDDYVSPEEKKQRQEKKRRDELVEELVSLTDDNTPPSPLLMKSEKEPTIAQLDQEVAQIKAETAKREQDQKARIQQVLEGLSKEEREDIREEALSRVDSFLYSLETFDELSRQDIRDWQGSGPVVSPLICRRDEIIKERYLKKT